MAKAKSKPRIFTRTIDGRVNSAQAFSAADAVRFAYDGWVEAVDPPPAPPVEDAEPAADKPAAKSDAKPK